MATTIQNQSVSMAMSRAEASAYDRFIERLKFSHFGLMSATLTIGSILGGIAAMYILKNDAAIWQLGLCMAVSMANNVAGISQAPTKWVFNLFILNVVVNVLLAAINFG